MKCKSACKIIPKKKSASANSHGKINTEAVEVLIRSKVPFVILDARGGEWDDGQRIPGAKQITSEGTAKEIAKLVPSKKSLIVVYCTNIKCPAGGYLVHRLLDLGYVNILKYEDGIEEWIAQGKPIKRTLLHNKK